jgi:hypothetical protein
MKSTSVGLHLAKSCAMEEIFLAVDLATAITVAAG